MKQTNLFLAIMFGLFAHSQSAIQSINSGSIIAANTSVSIGEIVIIPVNQLQSNTGFIGILTQINNQSLEVSQFEVSQNIVVYPNPTVSKLFFESKENLSNEIISLSDTTGKIVLKTFINSDNSLDLTPLSSGIYWIDFSNKKYKNFQIIKK